MIIKIQAKISIRILMSLVPIMFIGIAIAALLSVSYTNYFWVILASCVFLILGIDEIYQLMRVIEIDNKKIKTMIFKYKIENIEYKNIEINNKRYGIRFFTHQFGVKSILINGKYYDAISLMDNEFREIESKIKNLG